MNDFDYYTIWLDSVLPAFRELKYLDYEQLEHAKKYPKRWVKYIIQWNNWRKQDDGSMSSAMGEPNPPLYDIANND